MTESGARGFVRAVLDWHFRHNLHSELIRQAQETIDKTNACIARLKEAGQMKEHDELEALRQEIARLQALLAEREIA